MNRRHFLQFAAGAAILASGLIVPETALAKPTGIYVPDDATQFWNAPRQIYLARQSTGESFKIVYWRDGKVDADGYRMACHLLRDVQANKLYPISIRTLDLLRAIQGWLAYYGVDEPIIVLSGYRSDETNRHTEGAARRSKHKTGQAVDMTIPGIPTKYLLSLAATFRVGGLGFYPGKKFVHADDGPLRYWKG